MKPLIYMTSRYMFCHQPESWLLKELKRERHKKETPELKLKRLQILEEMLFLDMMEYTKEIIDDIYVRHFPVQDETDKTKETEVELPCYDHPSCKHRCQYSIETSEFPFPRVCPQGECDLAQRDGLPYIYKK